MYRKFLSNRTGASKRDIWTRAGGAGNDCLNLNFRQKFPIGLHVILQIQIKLDIAAVTDGVPCRGDPKLTPD